MSVELPARPRLADHVLARRHIVNGVEQVVLHDARSGRTLQLGPREWGLLAAADGTRDLEGIVLAAAREGAHARAAALAAFLEQLQAIGMLAEGPPEAARAGEAASAPERPIEVLPDFGLHCDGSGSCCRLYATVLFSPLEAARARALLPQVLDGGARHERVFLPEHGSAPCAGSAVTLRDGRCAYLGEEGRCGIHAVGGAGAKPLGCNLFPARFIDDGERVRVTAAVECACVLASVGREGGAPLVDAEARTRGDLAEAIFVAELPEHAFITRTTAASRAAVRAWSAELAAITPPVDVAAGLWALAGAIESGGFVGSAARFAGPAAPPRAEEVAPWIEALYARAARRAREDAAWRGERDLARRAGRWIEVTLALLREQGAIAAILEEPPARPEAEAFYVRAAAFGYGLFGELPLVVALRDRAVRVWLARAMPAVLPVLGDDDPAFAEPLALVEAMLRAYGIDAYAVHRV